MLSLDKKELTRDTMARESLPLQRPLLLRSE
jgi:hypothetical protein